MAAVFHTHAKGETLSRYIEIMLEKRNVRCVARMLDEEAPKTCEAVWSALPQSGDVYHAKYASNEIYTLVAPFAEEETGPENRTIAPAKGDVMYFHLPPGFPAPPGSARTGGGQARSRRSRGLLRPEQSLAFPLRGANAGERFRHHRQEHGRDDSRRPQCLA